MNLATTPSLEEMGKNRRISKMDALLFTLSLEVVLLQMRILEGSTELRLKNWRPVGKLEKLQRDKLGKNRAMVGDIVTRTLIELAETGEYQMLQNAVQLLKESDSAAATLRTNYEQLKSSRDTIKAELDTSRDRWVIELRNADQKVALLRDKTSDDIINASTRLCYAEKWLFARAESLDLQNSEEPRAPARRTEHEQCVHDELLRANELQIKEREESVEYWRERYTADTAAITRKVAEKCEQLRIAKARRAELQKVYDLHAGEMRSWLTFKRERAARLAREEHVRASAARIQAWWRGVMVRRALGAFKNLRHVKKAPPAKGKKK